MAGKRGKQDVSGQCGCSHGNCSSPDIAATLLNLVTKITDLLDKNSELTSELTEIKVNYKLLADRLDAIEKGREMLGQSKHVTAPFNDVNSLTSAVTDEMISRKEKELNVVIFGIDEPPMDVDPLTDEDEKLAVTNFLSDSLQIPNPQLTKVFRLGKRLPNRPRPLKVCFSDASKRKATLVKAKSLSRLPQGHKNRNVYIRPDLTKIQRDQEYVRRQKAKERTQPGQYTSQDQTPDQPTRPNV